MMKREALMIASMIAVLGNNHILPSSLTRAHWKETQSEEERQKALAKAEAKRQRKAK